jgi:sec-independent protein translocase protein TatA
MIVLVILLLMFGAKKLPELARGLGQAMKEFSKAKSDIHDEILREPAPMSQLAQQPAKQLDQTPVQTQQPAGTQAQTAQTPAAQAPVVEPPVSHA